MTPEQRTEQIIKKMSISREEFARALGVSRSLLAQYFTGHHRIRRVVALAIQGVYGINADWIMKGKKPVFLREQGSRLSEESREIAVMYDSLPRDIRTTARTVLEGLKCAAERA